LTGKLTPIWQTPKLIESPVGWYSSCYPNIFDPITSVFTAEANTKGVCFTESTLIGLRAHRDVFTVKYAIAFDRDWLFDKGANPCLNIRQELLKKGCIFIETIPNME
jgi:hypothetical protein